MKLHPAEQRPLIIAIAGPNGAGKTTFFYAHVAGAELQYVNADEIANALNLDAYAAANIADRVRRELCDRGVSFAFETVFSDPVGAKIELLLDAKAAGYAVLICFIWISDAAMSEERVAMRMAKGGHSVPIDKLTARYARTLENLRRAIDAKLQVIVFDNSELSDPFQIVAAFEEGKCDRTLDRLPTWLQTLLTPADNES